MSEEMTLLDAAYAAVSADPESDAARLRFYERLADGEMFLLLEKEVEDDKVEPRIFEVEGGPVVLIFDREERLAEFTGGVAPYAALPGRVIAGMLKGQGIGLGVNLGGAPSEMLLPAEALDWLAEALEPGPDEAEGIPEEFLPPSAPEVLITSLDAKLAKAAGLAGAALLAGVVYKGGRRGHILAFIDAAEGAQGPLARAAREALVFSGIEAGEIDVTFLSSGEPIVAVLAKTALRFDLAAPEPQKPAERKAPGMDPAKPPRLI